MLENEEIRLRALERADLTALYDIENDYSEWDTCNNVQPYSAYTLLKYIENDSTDIYASKQLRLVIAQKKNNKTIGMLDLYDFDPKNSRAYVGIVVDREHRNQSVATMALDLLIDYCFHFLGIHQLLSQVSIENKKSQRLFEKAGFVSCGLFKEYLKSGTGFDDVITYQFINKETT